MTATDAFDAITVNVATEDGMQPREGRVYPECPAGIAILWQGKDEVPVAAETPAWTVTHLGTGRKVHGVVSWSLPYARRLCLGLQELAIEAGCAPDWTQQDPAKIGPAVYLEAVHTLVVALDQCEVEGFPAAALQVTAFEVDRHGTPEGLMRAAQSAYQKLKMGN